MKCTLIYLKIVPKDKLSWIKYCHIFNALPQELQDNIKIILDELNEKYKDDLIIPFSYTSQTGCVVNSKIGSKVANDLFIRYDSMMKKYIDDPSIRIVYGIGDIEKLNVNSVHELHPEPVVVKVGRTLDKSDETGIWYV